MCHKTLKSLQNRQLSPSKSFEIIDSTMKQLNRDSGKVADAVRDGYSNFKKWTNKIDFFLK